MGNHIKQEKPKRAERASQEKQQLPTRQTRAWHLKHEAQRRPVLFLYFPKIDAGRRPDGVAPIRNLN
jgi:hypothetical protein